MAVREGSRAGCGVSLAVGVAALIAVALVLPSAALAGELPTPGKWSGKAGFGKVTFMVDGSRRKISNFTVKSLVVDCVPFAGPDYTTTITFYVPTIKVRSNGQFHRVYEQTNDKGEPDGRLEVDGFFSPSGKVRGGTVHYRRFGCFANHGYNAAAHGHNVGKKPPVRGKPVGGASYRGKTDQGFRISLKVSGNRRRVAHFKLKNIDAACSDGTSDSYNASWDPGEHVRLSRRGRFSRALRGGKVAVKVKGRVGASHGRGTVSVHEGFDGGSCDSGPVPFVVNRR
jgi:hypothetical protein